VCAITGLGLDIIDLNHFEVHYGNFDPELLDRCFTKSEILDTQGSTDRLARLAARFAGKEATIKALGGLEGCALTDIEIGSNEHGQPNIILYGQALAIAQAAGIASFMISLTHSAASVGAVVIAISVKA
jgi:holo-[acyl-carrier protein] synthase